MSTFSGFNKVVTPDTDKAAEGHLALVGGNDGVTDNSVTIDPADNMDGFSIGNYSEDWLRVVITPIADATLNGAGSVVLPPIGVAEKNFQDINIADDKDAIDSIKVERIAADFAIGATAMAVGESAEVSTIDVDTDIAKISPIYVNFIES